MSVLSPVTRLHDTVFGSLSRAAGDWFIPFAARFAFAAVLALYYWNSGLTKIGDGFFGFLDIQSGAYFSILGESGMLAYDFDTANVPFYLDIVVYLGSWMEFILPALVIIGLFTRVAALGMIFFVLVQSWVDVAVHKVGPETVGMLFDRISDSAIWDQRTLWVFLLVVLVIKGAGALSVDRLIGFDKGAPAN
jgi:putative oxidoreductase